MLRAVVFTILWVCGASQLAAEVLVSEVVAIGKGGAFVDEKGGATDWVELHNTGLESVNLTNWSLSRDPAVPEPWRFPAVDLPAMGYLVVHCSGQDRTRDPRALHTNFKLPGEGGTVVLRRPDSTIAHQLPYPPQLRDASWGFGQTFEETTLFAAGADGKYFVPATEGPAENWHATDFPEAGWIQAKTGYGYDFKKGRPYASLITTDLGTHMRMRSTSVYLRLPFDVDDPAAFDLLRLDANFEEGFVAYLNGHEVIAYNVPPERNWDSEALESRTDEAALRQMSFQIGQAQQLLHAGRNVLAVHCLIIDKASRDFLFVPSLVGLSLDALDLAQPLYLGHSTPGGPNGIGFQATTQPPTASVPSGTYPEDFPVTLRATDPGARITYTLDGREPTPSSALYGQPIVIRSNVTLRAMAVAPGMRPSPPIQEFYARLDASLLGRSSRIPIIVMSSFGRQIDPHDYMPVHAQIFDRDENGQCTIRSKADVEYRAAAKLRGSSTLLLPKSSYSLELRDETGDDAPASLLGMPAESDWVLYGAYKYDRSLIRNTFIYELGNQMGRYAPRTRFVELFVNKTAAPTTIAHYAGVYALIEKIKRGDSRVAVEKLTLADDSEPEIRGGYILKVDRLNAGDVGFKAAGERVVHVYPEESEISDAQAAWIGDYMRRFGEAIASKEFADPEKGYAPHIDVDSFIDFHIVQISFKNPDAFDLSTYLFKPRAEKLQMGPLWDFDRAMRTHDGKSWVGRADDPQEWQDLRVFGWWGILLQDPEFVRRYTARWRELRGKQLSLANLNAIIERQAALLTEAAERNALRWPAPESPGWRQEIEKLKAWITARMLWLDGEYFAPPSSSHAGGLFVAPATTVLQDRCGEGEVYYRTDGQDPRADDGGIASGSTRYTESIVIERPTRLRARTRLAGEVWSGELDLPFYTEPVTLAITEIMYQPPEGEDLEWLELTNYGSTPVDLTGLHFTDGIGFDFDSCATSTLAPGAVLLLVKNRKAFAEHYQVSESVPAGEFERRLDDDKERLTLIGAVGQEVIQLVYDGTWHPTTAGLGHSLVLGDVHAPPASWSRPESWRPSTQVGGTPGEPER